jgi:quercetin dioxygenase-like cupin family protein
MAIIILPDAQEDLLSLQDYMLDKWGESAWVIAEDEFFEKLRLIHRMSKTNLLLQSSSLPDAWRSVIVGRAANANVKVLRMDDRAYPNETHDFDEALLVLDGQMNLEIDGQVLSVRRGEVFIVPAGLPHAVAPGSHGALVIIDQ